MRKEATLPAAAGVVLAGGQGLDAEAGHRLAEAAGGLGDLLRVIVKRGGLDDRGGAPTVMLNVPSVLGVVAPNGVTWTVKVNVPCLVGVPPTMVPAAP